MRRAPAIAAGAGLFGFLKRIFTGKTSIENREPEGYTDNSH